MKKLLAVFIVTGLAVSLQAEGQAQAPAAATGIRGAVKFSGTAPAAAPLRREADPFCAKTKMNDETVLVNPNGTLKNVLVRVIQGAAPAAAPSTPVEIVIDQNNCMYRPRVTGVMAGQPVKIRNSDPVLHNVHSYLGAATGFNRAQPKGGKDIEQTFTAGAHKLKCDIHPWMTGWVVANANPFFAVTGDSGEYSLNLPPGTYTLEAWHEKYGTQTATVTVTAAGVVQDFTFTAAP